MGFSMVIEILIWEPNVFILLFWNLQKILYTLVPDKVAMIRFSCLSVTLPEGMNSIEKNI